DSARRPHGLLDATVETTEEPAMTGAWSISSGWLIGVFALALATAGCGPAVGSVKGTVKYKGKPVPQGVMVTFVPAGEAGRQCETDAEGRYSIQQVPVGTLKVTITKFVPPMESMLGGRKIPSGIPIKTPFGIVTTKAGPDLPTANFRIPDKYKNAESS